MNRSEDALSTVDSVDLTSGLLYKLQYKKCNQHVAEDEDDDLWGSDW
jgi:hypothetical protein